MNNSKKMATKNEVRDEKNKRARIVTTLEVKLKVLKESERGKSGASISRKLGIPASTVRSIILNKEKYRNIAEKATPGLVTFQRNRDEVILKMEQSLMLWINDQESSVSAPIVQNKALEIYRDLKSTQLVNVRKDKIKLCDNFKASKGWYERFKARAGLRGVKSRKEVVNTEKAGKGSIKTESENIARECDVIYDSLQNDPITNSDKNLTFSVLKSVFCHVEMVKKKLLDNDPSTKRSTKALRDLDDALKGYKDILNLKRRPVKRKTSDIRMEETFFMPTENVIVKAEPKEESNVIY